MNTTGKNKIKGTFFFDPADKIYGDHFPSGPVVPGCIIIHAFLDAARDILENNDNLLIKNFRFTKFISPGEYNFDIDSQAGLLKCRLFSNDKSIVTGEIII
ncbi:MAG: hypothetical protein MUC95_09330 [Spirochaetes bacterium]|jgi:3-hydroxyacyl-[acyl-carrier-protein] dehydratase|nr:hypothetical protein [Spirochaetota bacterium]